MTALDQYERLESGGLWRENADAQRRDVLVSFGNATLVIADNAARPLTHWSLPAIVRLNEGERPAVFAPDEDAVETLEIDDGTMIDAIEKVRRSLLSARPKPGRLRHILTAAVAVLIVCLGVFWFPNAVREQTLAVVPQSKRAEMGAIILGQLQSDLGPRCETPKGLQALKALDMRFFGPDSSAQVIVLPSSIGDAVALPGQIIVLDQARVETSDDPATVAGYVLAAYALAQEKDPLGPVVDHAGLQPTLQLLTTGELSRSSLESYAKTLIDVPQEISLVDGLETSFDLAQVPLAPLIKDLVARGQSIEIQGETGSGQSILSDSGWVALQGICDG